MDVLVLIDKLDDIIHNARSVPLTDSVMIDREEIYDILDQMRSTIPEEIKQARWIVKERQEMLAEAKQEAERVLSEAQERAARLASETEADNTVKFPTEGLSFLAIEGEEILLRDALAACGELIMGGDYAATHKSLGRLAKIYDFESRIFFHYHQTTADARRLGRNSKEESYYFLTGVGLGAHPETFFGVHPYIVQQGLQCRVCCSFACGDHGILPNWVDVRAAMPFAAVPTVIVRMGWNSSQFNRFFCGCPGSGGWQG